MRLTSRPLILLVLAALVVMAGLVGVNAYQSWEALQTARAGTERDVGTIRPWMSVRYVARSYGVPEVALESRLGAPAGPRITLQELARQRHVPSREIVAEARQAVLELRAGGSASSAPSPGTGP